MGDHNSPQGTQREHQYRAQEHERERSRANLKETQESLILKVLERTLDRLDARDNSARHAGEKAQPTGVEEKTAMRVSSKDNRENFQRWLTAPQSAGPINLRKIFKSIGYNVNVTRNDLPPAVAGILILRVLKQAPDLDQMMRCLDWFLRVMEVGLRFEKGNELLEYIRRAMELRRSSAGSWEDHDVWRAVDDHIMVARNSKVRLERHNLHRTGSYKKPCIDLLNSSSTSSPDSSGESSEEERRKRKRKRKRKRANKKREKRRKQDPTPRNTNATRSPWIAESNLARNQCSACRGFGH